MDYLEVEVMALNWVGYVLFVARLSIIFINHIYVFFYLYLLEFAYFNLFNFEVPLYLVILKELTNQNWDLEFLPKLLQSFKADRVHNVWVPGKVLIITQTSPFAAGFINEERIKDNFELVVCFDTLFDIDCFISYYIA